MNNLFLFVFFLLFMIVNSMNDNRFYDRDDDIQNRLTNINHYSVLPMKGGGGWPSTTGNSMISPETSEEILTSVSG